MTQQHLHIVDAQTQTDADYDEPGAHASEKSVADVAVEAPTVYEEAIEPNWSDYDRQTGAFIKSLLPTAGKEEYLDDRRSVHHFDQLDDLRLVDDLDTDETGDVDLASLFVLPDESLLFVGKDPTTKDTAPLFGFVIEPFAPVPEPDTAQDALDLLRPGAVRDAFDEGVEPDRQGEWWLLPTQKVPVGTRFRPGVNERPYGPSPLGNHVPREWGMTVSDDVFMTTMRDRVEGLPGSIETPPEVIEWVHRQHQRVPIPDYAPEWDVVQDAAGDLLVRGTLRHRENDHYTESLSDDWHTAITHDMDVYTADEFDRVVLD